MSDEVHHPEHIAVVIPSRVGVGETFEVKVRLLGPIRTVPSYSQWNTWIPL